MAVRSRRLAAFAPVFLLVLICGSGCTGVREYIHNGLKVGPNYKRPAAPVADDNVAASEIIQEALRGMVQCVDVVSSGPAAVAEVRRMDARQPYDVVYMDWRMPGMDGLQAARLIRSDESMHQQPAIVLVTAFGREEIRDEASFV